MNGHPFEIWWNQIHMAGQLWSLIMQSINFEKYGAIRGNTNWRKVKIQKRETVFGANHTIYSITNL